MSDISQHKCISPQLSHCFVTALFRTAIVWRFLAALLPIPALASSSARSFLITVHSCFTLRWLMSRFPCFSILTEMGAWSEGYKFTK